MIGFKQQKKITNIDVATYTFGSQGDIIDNENKLKVIFGIESDGAILFRPDGYVAWRIKEKSSNNINNVLEKVISQLLTIKITLSN